MTTSPQRSWYQFRLRTLLIVTALIAAGACFAPRIWDRFTGWPKRISGMMIYNFSGERLENAQIHSTDGSILLDTSGEVNLVDGSGFGRGWEQPSGGPRIGRQLLVTWTDASGRKHNATVRLAEFQGDEGLSIEIGPKGMVTCSRDFP